MVGKSQRGLGSLLAGMDPDVPIWMPRPPRNRNVFEDPKKPCKIVVDLYECHFDALQKAIKAYNDTTDIVEYLTTSGHSLASSEVEDFVCASVSKLQAVLKDVDEYNHEPELGRLTELYTTGLKGLWDKEMPIEDLQTGYNWCTSHLAKVLSQLEVAIHYERTSRDLDEARSVASALAHGGNTGLGTSRFVPLALTTPRPVPGILTGKITSTTTPNHPSTKSSSNDRALMPPPPLPPKTAMTSSSPTSTPAAPTESSGKRKRPIPTTLAPQSTGTSAPSAYEDISDTLAGLSIKRRKLSAAGNDSASLSLSSNSTVPTSSPPIAPPPLSNTPASNARPIAMPSVKRRSSQTGPSTGLRSAGSTISLTPPTMKRTTSGSLMPPPPLPKPIGPAKSSTPPHLLLLPLTPPSTPKARGPVKLTASLPIPVGIARPAVFPGRAAPPPTPVPAQLAGKRKRSVPASPVSQDSDQATTSKGAHLADDADEGPAKRCKTTSPADVLGSLPSSSTASSPKPEPKASGSSVPTSVPDGTSINDSSSLAPPVVTPSAMPAPPASQIDLSSTVGSPASSQSIQKSASSSISSAKTSVPLATSTPTKNPYGSRITATSRWFETSKSAVSPPITPILADPDVTMVDVWLLDFCDYFGNLALECESYASGFYKNSPFRFDRLTKIASVTKGSKQDKRTNLQKDRLLSYARSI